MVGCLKGTERPSSLVAVVNGRRISLRHLGIDGRANDGSAVPVAVIELARFDRLALTRRFSGVPHRNP